MATADIDGAELSLWRQAAFAAEAAVNSVVIGQAGVVRLVTCAVFARGHVLLQGDVGVGKTTLLRAFARVIGGAFARIEGSIDLMPNDLLYYTYLRDDGRPAVEAGPLVAEGERLSILFFNEINRARPQVHALLLRAMAERTVRAFNRDVHFPHLQVFADRNQLEREETFEIASAALDRFMMEIRIELPDSADARRAVISDTRFHDVDALVSTAAAGLLDREQLNRVAAAIQAHTQVRPALLDYVTALWEATRAPHKAGLRLEGIDGSGLILAGASPRGMSMLLQAARVTAWLAARDFVTPQDVRAVFVPVIAHRLVLQPLHEARRTELSVALSQAILDRIGAP